MSEITKIVDSKSVDLDELFNNTQLYVPAYQRPYSWEERQVRELWSDIYQCYIDKDLHFIGPMYFKYVTRDTESWLEVTDGQQRVTSFYLLLLAFKRLLKIEYNYDLLHGDSTYQFIDMKIESMITKKDKSRLQLGASDRFAFNLIFRSYDTIPENVKSFGLLFGDNEVFLNSAKLLHKNFFYFYNQLKKIHNEDFVQYPDYASNPKITNRNEVYLHYRKKELVKFKNIFDTITDRFSMIRCIISTDDESRVFKLFETINDRGRPLDQVDKIKNYLFMNVYNYYKVYKKEQLDEVFEDVQNKWAEIQECLDNHIEEYIRYYLISQNSIGKHIKKKNLYLEISKFFDSTIINNIKDFVNSDLLTKETKDLLKCKNFITTDEELKALLEVELDDVVIEGVRAHESRRIICELAKYCRSYLQIINPSKCEFVSDLVVRANLKYTIDYTICRTLLLKLIMDYQDNHDKKNLERLRKLIIITTNISLLYVGVFSLGKMDNVEEEIYKLFFKKDRKYSVLVDCTDFKNTLMQSMEKVSSKFTWTSESLKKQISECSNDSVAYIIQCKLNDYKTKRTGAADFFYPKVLIEHVEGFCLNKDHILPQSPNPDYRMLIDDYYTSQDVEVPIKKKFDDEVTKRIGNIIPIHRDTNIKATNGQHLPFFKTIEPKGILLFELLKDFKIDQPWLPNHVELRSNIIANQIIIEGALTLDESDAMY